MAFQRFNHIGSKLVVPGKISQEEMIAERIKKAGGKEFCFNSEDMEEDDFEDKSLEQIIEEGKCAPAEKGKIRVARSIRARRELNGEREEQAVIICVKYFNQYKPGDELRVYTLDQADPGKRNHIDKAKMFCEKHHGTFRIQIIHV